MRRQTSVYLAEHYRGAGNKSDKEIKQLIHNRKTVLTVFRVTFPSFSSIFSNTAVHTPLKTNKDQQHGKSFASKPDLMFLQR